MSQQDLRHARVDALHAMGENRPPRVILPVAAIGPRPADFTDDSDIVRVEATVAALRVELNAAAPEVASWWSAPALWFGDDICETPGTAGLRIEHYRIVLAETIRALLAWAEQVVVITTNPPSTALPHVVGALRLEGHRVIWCATTQSDQDIHTLATAVRFEQPDTHGEITFGTNGAE